jgi:hypothetical protein
MEKTLITLFDVVNCYGKKMAASVRSIRSRPALSYPEIIEHPGR